MAKSIYLLSTGMFALGLDAYVVAGLLPDIANTFKIDSSDAGLCVAIFTLSYALSAPLLATMLAGCPARTVLCVALATFTCANIASALAPTFGVLLVSRAIAGSGAGLYSPFAAASAVFLAGQERKGSVLGFILGGMSLGTVLGVPAGLSIGEHVGWRGTLWLVAAIGGVALTGVAIFFPPVVPAPPPSLCERFVLIRNRHVARIVGVTFLLSVGSLGLYTYVAPILAESGSISEIRVFLTAWGVGGIVGSLLIGCVVDLCSRKADVIYYITILLLLVFLLLPPALGSDWPALAMGLFFFWGMLGWASQTPQQHNLLSAHGCHGAAAVALNSSANYLGSTVGVIFGEIFLKQGGAPRELPLVAVTPIVAALLLQRAFRGAFKRLTVKRGETK